MLPHLADGELDYDVGTLLYHDRNLNTLGYDPAHCRKDLRKIELSS